MPYCWSCAGHKGPALASCTFFRPPCAQTTWEVVQHSALLQPAGLGSAPSETGVFVGIQQMEYGGLAAPHLRSLGPFSGGTGS